MARALRVQYPGAIYHVLSRGDRRELIVRDDQDRAAFVRTLEQACAKTGWQVHAWCLMSNHFHVVIETPRANLAPGMKWFLGTYTQRYNARHQLRGHVFGGRYKAVLVDTRAGEYLRTVCDYVHLNPARAGLIAADDPLEQYRWSSYPHYLLPARRRPGWLRVDRLLGEHGIQRDSAAGRREFALATETIRREQLSPELIERIRRGWKFGADDFVKWLMEKVGVRTAADHQRPERDETEIARADRIVREELVARNWTEDELTNRRKGDPEKVLIAARLRKETAVTLKWIASRLQMGAWTHVTNRLYHASKAGSSVNT